MPEIISLNAWWVAALASTLFYAACYLVQEYAKLPSQTMVFYRGFVPFVLLLPVVVFLPWPSAPQFYVIVLLTSLFASWADNRSVDGVVKYGAGISSRAGSYGIWVSFVIWLLWDDVYRHNLFSNLQALCAVMVCLAIAVYGTTHLRKQDVSRDAIAFIIPAIIVGAFMDVFNKMAMSHAELFVGAILYAWLQATLVCLQNFYTSWRKKSLGLRSLIQPQALKSGIAYGVGVVGVTVLKNVAMTFAANPAYVSAIKQVVPIWIIIFYKMVGRKDDRSAWAGFLIVVSAVLLIFTNLFLNSR